MSLAPDTRTQSSREGLRYSFVVPIYNDGELAADFAAEFERVFQRHLGQERIDEHAELIFVDDGSRNASVHVLLNDVLPRFKFVRVIELSRNFGQHIALSCGYQHARGQYVGMLNVDMEDPPDQIPALLAHLERGEADIVHGLYEMRDVTWLNRMTSHAFNSVLNRLTGYAVPQNSATLRIMNRRFVDAYNSLTEKSRYIPGLEFWLGFRHAYQPMRHQRRTRGSSSYNFRRRLRMALETIISFSDLPLKMAAALGMGIALVGLLMVLFLVISKLFFVDYQAGYTSTISITVFLGGVQILVVGLASLYIGRILREVQNRPLYVVREVHEAQR
ncbi:glycosyltransferase family 2 protein [Myxococcaceae bacterium JPH2]|nr:glycosyltransferase family 2 protein [Myxococcaceae bacterium JPH2]